MSTRALIALFLGSLTLLWLVLPIMGVLFGDPAGGPLPEPFGYYVRWLGLPDVPDPRLGERLKLWVPVAGAGYFCLAAALTWLFERRDEADSSDPPASQ